METTGKNPPLVLLHGGGSTIDTSFGKVLQSFAKTRQVIAFEQVRFRIGERPSSK